MTNKKFHNSKIDHLCFEPIWEQIFSKLGCGAHCVNEALIDLNTIIAIATETTSKPQCGF